MSDLLIVIVNYKTPGLTIDCLRSLEPELAAVPSTRVVVTDNLSGGDSVQQIGAAIAANNWGSWATLMPLPRNGGFAYGNNEGIRPALESAEPPRYVWLLNPDTLVKPGAIRAMIDFLDADPKVGIAGTRVINEDDTVRRSAFRFHTAASEFEAGLRLGVVSKLLSDKVVAQPIPTTACEVDWVSGASMFVRPEDVAKQIPCGPDLDAVLEAVKPYLEAGFTDVAIVQVGDEGQSRFLDQAAKPLLEKLRAA